MLIINEYIPTDLFKNLEFAMAYYSTNYVLAFCGLLQLGVVNVLTKKKKKIIKSFISYCKMNPHLTPCTKCTK